MRLSNIITTYLNHISLHLPKWHFINENRKKKIGIPKNVLALKVANFVARDILSVSFLLFLSFLKNTEKNYIFLLCCFVLMMVLESKERKRIEKSYNGIFVIFNFVFSHILYKILEITKNVEIFSSLNLTSLRQKIKSLWKMLFIFLILR